jgi:predicted PurR-regulated permease PerM
MENFSPAARAVLVVAAATIVILGVRIASPVITPVLLALVIAVTWSAFPAWLRSHGITGYWTVIVALLSVVLVFAVLGLVVAVSLIRFEERLPVYEERLLDVEADIESFVNDLSISDEPVDIGGLFAEEVFSAERLTGLAQDSLQTVFGAAGLGALIFLISLFMLAESRDWGRKFSALPEADEQIGVNLERFVVDVRAWLLVTLGAGALVAVPCTIALMLFQVDFAVLWGIVILVFSFVPSIGFIISVIPPVAVAWLLHGPWIALAVLLTIVVINTAVDNFIKPRIVGRRLSMSPLVLIIAVVFWSWVLGPLGAFLSTPLTLLLRFGLDTYPDTRWLARMMGTGFSDAEPLALGVEPAAGPGD